MSYNGQTRLAWDANSESDLAGYKVYSGVTPRVYSANVSTTDLFKVVTGLDNGLTWYHAVTAYDQTGNESTFSAEVSKLVTVSVLQVLRRVA